MAFCPESFCSGYQKQLKKKPAAPSNYYIGVNSTAYISHNGRQRSNYLLTFFSISFLFFSSISFFHSIFSLHLTDIQIDAVALPHSKKQSNEYVVIIRLYLRST